MYGRWHIQNLLVGIPVALLLGGALWVHDRFFGEDTTEEQKTEVVAATAQPSETAAPVVEEKQVPKPTAPVEKEIKDPVYICNSGSSECYHRTADCEGLIYCNSSVTKVSKEDAEKKHHRRPCHYCYGW